MVTDSLYKDYADKKYLEFSKKLSPTDTLPRAGVSITDLRKIAKSVSFDDIEIKYHEDVILKGISLGYEKIPFEDKIPKLNDLLPFLSSWDQTDTIQSSFKPNKSNRDMMWRYFKGLLSHKDIFPRRLGIVWLMSNRKTIDWQDALDNIIAADSEDEYYIMMAVAWALSFFYIDNPSILPVFDSVSETTRKKTKQKIRESRRYKGEKL